MAVFPLASMINRSCTACVPLCWLSALSDCPKPPAPERKGEERKGLWCSNGSQKACKEPEMLP